MAKRPDSDETVVLRRRKNWRQDWRRHIPIAMAAAMVLGTSAAAFNMWRGSPPQVDVPPVARPAVAIMPAVSPASVIRPEFVITRANEAEILADQPTDVTVFRFKDNPAVVVLDFANLAEQAQMLNRMAVFEEKDGLPHDRVLTDAELDKAIRGGGDDPVTFYYGHDYRAAALVHFFALADRDHITLTIQEERLRRLIAQLGWTDAGAAGALISLPRLAVDDSIDPSSRATILRHELSHGEYFTNPDYAAFVQKFWSETMNEGDRTAFRAFLVRNHYDGSIDDLIVNESIAYLMHTPDARFFSAAAVGLPQARVDKLRAAFVRNMPKGWLYDLTALPAPVLAAPSAPARAPRRRRRRGYGAFGAVSRTRTSAVMRAPLLRAASIADLSAER